MNLSELKDEIKKRPLEERAALARWLLQSLEELSETEIEALWIAEAERRLAEMESGKVAPVSAEDAFRRARVAIS